MNVIFLVFHSGIDREFTFPDPSGIIGNQTLQFEISLHAETVQGVPHGIVAVPAFGVQPHLAAQLIDGIDPFFYDFIPGLFITGKHAEIFRSPALGGIGPVGTDQVEDLPQRNHLVRFVHRFAGILIDKEKCTLFIHRCLQVFKGRLGLSNLFQHVLDDENKIIGRQPHGTGRVGGANELAAADDS